jgi:uncharacterized membrane protein
MHRVERVIEIGAPLERVFDLFSDFESFPRWMRHVREVRRTGRRYTRWRADAPLGMDIEWEAETTIFEPDRRIAWRSMRGDIETDGEVVFSEIDAHTTRLRIILGYAPPAGRLGDAFARLIGRDPAEELREDLERFKRLAERAGDGRERRSAVRPAAQRAPAHDDRERDDYERENYERGRRAYVEPRGSAEPRSDERYYREVLDMPGREDYDERAHRHVRDDERRARGARPRSRDRDESTHARDFDEALRAARRSQVEAMRRYQPHPSPAWQRMIEAEHRIEREDRPRGEPVPRGERMRRDERAPHGERMPRGEHVPHGARARERDERGRERDERERVWRRRREEEERGRFAVEDERAERERAATERPRYAMTPRERERERAERGWDREARTHLLRRRVDRLIDEGPSRDWRRWD